MRLKFCYRLNCVIIMGMHSEERGAIAIIGSRGIPATYGGFESVVEAIAPRLAEAGWKVFVSCEASTSPDRPDVYKGVHLFYFPLRPFFRIVYEPLYDMYSLIRASLLCDCIYMMGYGAGLFFFIPRIFRKPLAVNVDGLEWERAKFSRLEKLLLLASEKAAVTFANVIVADSLEIKRYIESSHKKEAIYIAYGVDTPRNEGWDGQKLAENSLATSSANLVPGDYWLVVARLEPENNIHTIINAFLKAGSNRRLVIVGNFSNKRYEKHVTELMRENRATGKVILAGAIYDMSLLNMLRQNCFAYIHGHSVGGTNPALLEAMSMKNLIIAHDNNFNREVGEETLLYFKDASDLAAKIGEIETKPDLFARLKEAAHARVVSNYSWQDVIEKYDSLFKEIMSRRLTSER